MPLVSVIIPTYNSQENIKQCLESIKKQTYKKLEILLVDRYSKDRTVTIAKKYGARIFLLDCERSRAKNYGAKIAIGEFLLFIDSDMRLNPKVIEECVDISLNKNADAIIIPETYIGHGVLGKLREKEKASLSKIGSFVEMPRFFNKGVFLHIGGFDEELVCGEDFDLLQRLVKQNCKVEKAKQRILHSEGNPSLRNVLSKAYNYGKTIPSLLNKNPSATLKRYVGIRVALLNDIKFISTDLRLLTFFAIIKWVEFTAYTFGVFSQLAHSLFERHEAKTLKNAVIGNKKIILNIALITLIALTIFRNFLFTNEWPGGGDVLGFISRAYLYGKDLRWLYSWRPYSFGFVEGINFMDFFLMSFYLVLRDPAWTVKTFIFLSYLTAGLSMYLFAFRYTHVHEASLAASLVYILNQWLFSQLTEAHVDIIFSYALAPLIFLFFDRALKTSKFEDIVLFSLGISLFITSFHPECIVIYGVFLIIFAFFFVFFPSKAEAMKIRFFKFLKVLLPSMLLAFLLSAFCLVPYIASVKAQYLHPSYEYPLEDSISCSYENLYDAFTLRAVERWGYVDLLDVYTGMGLPDFPVYSLLFIILLLAYGTLLKRRDRYTTFFALSMLISVFIAKGPHPPLGQAFIWAWFNVPHFSVFRAANRWVMMAAFSHAFFVAVLVCRLLSNIKSKSYLRFEGKPLKKVLKLSGFGEAKALELSMDFVNQIFKEIHKILHFLAIILLILVFINGFFACFFFFSYGLQVYTPPKLYREPYEWITNLPCDYKVVSVGCSPSEWDKSPVIESDFAHSAMRTTIGWGHDIGFDSSFIHDKPVLQNGGWDFRPRELVDYMRFYLVRNKLTKKLLQILGVFSYKYIVIPPYISDETREFFLNQVGYTTIYNKSSLILENNYSTSRIFATKHSLFILGGFESFQALSTIEGLDLNRYSLYFAPTTTESLPLMRSTLNRTDVFFFVNSDILDLAMLSFDKPNLILVGSYGASSLNVTEYWVKRSSWRTVGALTFSGETLTTIGKNRIDIPFQIDSDGFYDIWLRVGFAPYRGELTIMVDGEPTSPIIPEYPHWSTLKWVKITSLKLAGGKHLISLENDGKGYNDVDAIAIIKPEDLEKVLNETLEILQNFSGRIAYYLDAEKFFFNHSNRWSLKIIPYEGCSLFSENPEVADSAPLKITIPRRGNYRVAVRIATGPDYGILNLNLDGNVYTLRCDNLVNQLEWREIGPVNFDVGEHLISLSGAGSVELDAVLIYSIEDEESNLSLEEIFVSSAPDVNLNYSQVNPCLYQINVIANESFTLVFSETYNPLWKILVNSEEVSPLLTYGVVNSFYINKTGKFTLTLYFTGQSYVDVGLTISMASFTMITFSTALYILYKRVLRKLHVNRTAGNHVETLNHVCKDFKGFKNADK
jgi:glycosyltransferase involved in cell wall biosynthesis